MKGLGFLFSGVISMFFVSCVEEKNLYVPEEPTGEVQSGLEVDFAMKSEKSLSLTATDGSGKSWEGVKFGVFTQQPYTGEGVITIDPIFVGYTDASGKLNAEVVVANNVSKLYVAPLTAGYGEVKEVEVQDHISLDFNGVAFPQSAAIVSRAATDNEIPQFSGPISNLYDLYVPYSNADVDKDGIPVQGGCSLVSKEQLSPALINKINSWYPEKQNVQTENLSLNSDLIIVDENGAQVWVTYVGDGGFYVENRTTYNSLMYYNYQEGELTNHEDVSKLHMTMLLPNTNQLQCPSGLKVQLLYWNGSEYSKTFPKGTRIGFAVARAGFKKDGTNITERTAYSFKNNFNPVVDGDVSGMYYSTPALNKWKRSQAVTRELDGYNCCVTGFDIRPYGDNKSDYDFNDVMIKVTATPEDAIKPGENIPADEDVMVAESIHGTLAFEDQWPSEGDYDLNDFVVNYTYSVYKNEDNKIAGIQMRLKPIARGAATYTTIGFGMELPVAASEVDTEKIEGATLESGHSKATLIIWENVTEPFGGVNDIINTRKGVASVPSEEIVVKIPLKNAVSNVSMMKFNPFIFVNNRSREIHLTDFAPTSKMDMSLLGSGKDRSNVAAGIYYRMEDMFCWALDFPRASADASAWRYPQEKSSVVKAYKNYNKWVVNKTDLSWFDSNIAGNVDESELY